MITKENLFYDNQHDDTFTSMILGRNYRAAFILANREYLKGNHQYFLFWIKYIARWTQQVSNESLLEYVVPTDELERTPLDWRMKGVMCEYGLLPEEQNYSEAFRCYQIASEHGDMTAKLNLANLYLDGAGCTKDIIMAQQLFRAAKDFGNRDSLGYETYLYSKKQKNYVNWDKVRNQYQFASDGGDTESMHCLGRMYWSGQGVTKNRVTAQKWFFQAACRGNPHSMFTLASILEGHGDRVGAIKWYQRATDMREQDSANHLARLIREANEEELMEVDAFSRDYLYETPCDNSIKIELKVEEKQEKNIFDGGEDSALVRALYLLSKETIANSNLFKSLALFVQPGLTLDPGDSTDLNSVVKMKANNEIKKFLSGSDADCMLLQGDAGRGKSLFCQWLTQSLWLMLAKGTGRYLPIYIPLGAGLDPKTGFLKRYLLERGLSSDDIENLKNRPVLIIFDGYDELQNGRDGENLYENGELFGWQAKVIITCRNERIADWSKEKITNVFAPFSEPQGTSRADRLDKKYLDIFCADQIKQYISKFYSLQNIAKNQSPRATEEMYNNIVSVPGLVQMVRTPLLLNITLEVLQPLLESKDRKSIHNALFSTRHELYQNYMRLYFEIQEKKLLRANKINRGWPDIKKDFYKYSQSVAAHMLQSGENSIDVSKGGGDFYLKVNTENNFVELMPDDLLPEGAGYILEVSEKVCSLFYVEKIKSSSLSNVNNDSVIKLIKHRCNITQNAAAEIWKIVDPAGTPEGPKRPRDIDRLRSEKLLEIIEITGYTPVRFWIYEYFHTSNDETVKNTILRSGCPLMAVGKSHFQFIHRSFMEFFAAEHLFNSPSVRVGIQIKEDLNKMLLTYRPEVIYFASEKVKESKELQSDLWRVMNESRVERRLSVAAANAATILCASGFSFANKNLSGMRLQGANLSHGNFAGADFRRADLRGVNFVHANLAGADFSRACLEDVTFSKSIYKKNYVSEMRGQLNLEKSKIVQVSPDRKWIVFLDNTGGLFYSHQYLIAEMDEDGCFKVRMSISGSRSQKYGTFYFSHNSRFLLVPNWRYITASSEMPTGEIYQCDSSGYDVFGGDYGGEWQETETVHFHGTERHKLDVWNLEDRKCVARVEVNFGGEGCTQLGSFIPCKMVRTYEAPNNPFDRIDSMSIDDDGSVVILHQHQKNCFLIYNISMKKWANQSTYFNKSTFPYNVFPIHKDEDFLKWGLILNGSGSIMINGLRAHSPDDKAECMAELLNNGFCRISVQNQFISEKIPYSDSCVEAIRLSADGKRAALITRDSLHVFCTQSGKVEYVFKLNEGLGAKGNYEGILWAEFICEDCSEFSVINAAGDLLNFPLKSIAFDRSVSVSEKFICATRGSHQCGARLSVKGANFSQAYAVSDADEVLLNQLGACGKRAVSLVGRNPGRYEARGVDEYTRFRDDMVSGGVSRKLFQATGGAHADPTLPSTIMSNSHITPSLSCVALFRKKNTKKDSSDKNTETKKGFHGYNADANNKFHRPHKCFQEQDEHVFMVVEMLQAEENVFEENDVYWFKRLYKIELLADINDHNRALISIKEMGRIEFEDFGEILKLGQYSFKSWLASSSKLHQLLEDVRQEQTTLIKYNVFMKNPYGDVSKDGVETHNCLTYCLKHLKRAEFIVEPTYKFYDYCHPYVVSSSYLPEEKQDYSIENTEQKAACLIM